MDEKVPLQGSSSFNIVHEIFFDTWSSSNYSFLRILNMYAMFDLNLMITKGERKASSDWSIERFFQLLKGWDYNDKYQVIRFIISIFADTNEHVFLKK